MTAPTNPCELLEIIDLKWLLAGDGHRVHVERLMSDTDYARHCLLLAVGSSNKTTQAAALRIAARLEIVLHQAP